MDAVYSSTNWLVGLVNRPPQSFMVILLLRVDGGEYLRRQSPQTDETDGRLMIEGVLRRVGGQLFIVQRLIRLPAGDYGMPFKSLTRTVPLTVSCVTSIKASSAFLSGENHKPS